jgi:surfeit locus 1 family protein
MSAASSSYRRALAPREWWAHVLAAVLVAGAGLLGWWQLEAWQERRAAEAVDLTELVPVPLADVFGPDEAFPARALGRPVEITGKWVPAETFLVAAPGGSETTWVVTPVIEVDTGSVLPVVRGALTGDAVRPPAPEGVVTLVARLQPSDDVVRIPEVAQDVDGDLYSGYAVAMPGQPGTDSLTVADLEQLPAPSRFTALRNLLYAIEWWVFGLFAAFIWWRHVRDLAAGPEENPPDDEPTEEGVTDDVVPSEP